MKNMEIYKGINNPLDEESFIDRIMNAYSGENFYFDIVGVDSFIRKEADISEGRIFFENIFTQWKNEILSKTTEEWKALIAEGRVDSDILPLLEYLNSETTLKDIRENSELSATINKYGMVKINNSFIHIVNPDFTKNNEHRVAREHRLYLNVDIDDIFKLAQAIVETCERNNLPYYFMIDKECQREDSIVMITDTEHLAAHIDILRQIRKEHPELKIGQPPALTGKIEDWLGYGSEPLNQWHSFNSIRSEMIERALDAKVKEWYIRAIESENANGQENIATLLARKFLEEKTQYDSETIQMVEKGFANILGRMLINWTTNSENESCYIPILDIEFLIRSRDIERFFREYSQEMIQEKPELKEELKIAIKEAAVENRIDPENICFDLEQVGMLKKADESGEISYEGEITTPEEPQGTIENPDSKTSVSPKQYKKLPQKKPE